MQKVSVIIPAFNCRRYIEETVESALNQTYPDIELIVVDDASTDKTCEILKRYGEKLTVINHKNNKGPSGARNTGIQHARGEYVAFLDHDDIWVRDKLEKQMKVFQRGTPRLGAVGAGRVIEYKTNGRTETKIPSGRFGNIYMALLKGKSFPGGTPTIVIRRQCFEKVGLFDESFESSQEYDLYIRIAKHYYFDVVPEPLIKCNLFEVHSISANARAQLQGNQQLLLKYSKDIPLISLLKARRNFGIGIELCRRNEIAHGRNYLFKALLAYPFALKYWANLLLALFPSYHYLLFQRTWLRRKTGLQKK